MTTNYEFLHKWELERYSLLYTAAQITEKQVVSDIVGYLVRFSVDVSVIDAGGRRSRGQMMAIAKRAGLPPEQLNPVLNIKTGRAFPEGFSDMEATLAPGGRSLYIEAKAPAWVNPKTGKVIRAAGVPDAKQLAFLQEKHKRGALVMVAWSWEDVEWFLGSHVRMNHKVLSDPERMRLYATRA